MHEVIPVANTIPGMSEPAIAKVRNLETAAMLLPQEAIATSHLFHAGLYARTVRIPAGIMITGALVKIATVLIVAGECILYGEGGARELSGYHVLAAGAGRKQAFLARRDTHLTMLFASDAQTVAAAEAAFTDEADLLLSRRAGAPQTPTQPEIITEA